MRYDKSKYHMKDVIIGKAAFLMDKNLRTSGTSLVDTLEMAMV